MDAAYLLHINLIVPAIGLCILTALLAAVAVEPVNDHSRKIYMLMLQVCAGILIIEILQVLLEGRTSGTSVLVYRIVQFVFFSLLLVISVLWTLYSYYWFNGALPRKKLYICFAAGPAVDFALLIAGIFNNGVYSVSPEGVYARGQYFTFFIFLCYLSMVVVIIVTAVAALMKNGKAGKKDFLLFFLFFVFPLLGPIMQYLMFDMSVMGVSEAIAMLIVYLAVQQRISERYAVERAKYQDAYRTYEKSLEDLLSTSADALFYSHVNLTQNTRRDEHISSADFDPAAVGDTADELFEGIRRFIKDAREADRFGMIFSREQLLKDFSGNIARRACRYHRVMENGESHMVRTSIGMLKNPDSGDVEAILYSTDVDRQEKEERVISAITNREFDYIALVSVESRKFHYQYSSNRAVAPFHIVTDDYDEAMREKMAGLFEPEEAEKQYARICFDTVIEALGKQEEYSFFYNCKGPSGETLHKKIAVRYLDDDREEILFLRNDITQEIRNEMERTENLEKALQESRHANAMKTEFLSNVSHDMRTPLNAVLGYIGLAEKSQDLEAVRSYLEKTEKAGKILLSLVNDTLDLSKIETGVVTLKPAPISCGEVIRKVVAAIKPAMDEKHQKLVLDNSRAVMATINVDALRLQEIFINLLSNAVKFTPENGTITMVVECVKLEKNCVHDRVIIKDTGCGMSSAFLPKAFKPFSQERQETTKNIGGSGLGLSIVKKLVELMGGTIEVQSELGKGTAFTVYLDLERVDDLPDESSGAENSWDGLKDLNVLLVDDNEMNIEIAKTVLEMRDMKVTCAENGKIACDLFAASEPGHFGVILMDIRMPVMNGREATEAIRQMDRSDANVPIIAMSADAFDDDVRASLDAGMNGHLAKPIDPETLYRTISGIIGRK
ncbi:MAG: ATP-binding protein [Lachnospiraceae bacterium]|jgi:signal transduction histidine kinase/CheY-like chemotaxis protein|nr:ATP-binding protein [Lachnospiraceae bacterium]